MHELFVACLFGGAFATALFAILGFAGGAGHVGHGHVGHVGHPHLHLPRGVSSRAGSGSHGPAAHGAHGSTPQGSHAPSAGHGQTAQAHASGAGQATHGRTAGAPTQAQIQHGWLSASAGWTLTWLSPLTLAAAALCFGAVGLLAEGALGPVVLIVAILAALVGAGVVRAMMNALVRASTPPLTLTGEGAIGTVNATILPNAPGEVIYTLEGLHRSAPARSVEGVTIPRGTTVVVTRREGGFAWVTALDPLSEFQNSPEVSTGGDHRLGPAGESRSDLVDTGG